MDQIREPLGETSQVGSVHIHEAKVQLAVSCLEEILSSPHGASVKARHARFVNKSSKAGRTSKRSEMIRVVAEAGVPVMSRQCTQGLQS